MTLSTRNPALTHLLALAVVLGSSCRAVTSATESPVYRSPFQLAFSPDGMLLAVSDHTAGSLVLLEADSGQVVWEAQLGGRPAGVVWSADGRFAYTADSAGNEISQVSLSGRIEKRLTVGPRPVGLTRAGQRMIVANSAADSISILTREKQHELPAGHVPYMLAITPDGKLAVVGNRLPTGDASDPTISATVTLLDLCLGNPTVHVGLPRNSTNVHGVTVSPDGRWAYVVHNLARAMLPTEQIEYGWINANAMTVIDLQRRRRYATILLDRLNEGAANPFGLALSPDGSTLWITLAGVHQLGRVDLARLHRLLIKELPKDDEKDGNAEPSTARGSMQYSDSWRLGTEDRNSVELVTADLPAEYGHGRYLGKIFFRADLPGNGPRGLAVSPDGRQLAVAMYFSGTIATVEAATMKVTRIVAVGPQPPTDQVRRGESIFHDAKHCFQHWLSCSTCHPDGRADAINWDLINDGIGNPKNTRSLVLAHRTPPAMSRGVRSGMSAAAAAGFSFLLFQKPKENDLRAVEAYIKSLAPEKSPLLVDGNFSEKARRGKAIFESPKTSCSGCHPGPLMTDLQLHDVGTATGRFDTPTLVELWRTAPYLHHGRAATLRDVLTTMNPSDRHGRTSHLSSNQIDALVEYLRSL